LAKLHFPLPGTTLLRAGIALAAVFLTVWSQWMGAAPSAHFADEWLRDRFINLRAVSIPEPRILVVDIDESSLARYPWPWPRERIADVVETLLAGGARGVALDILQEKTADAAGDSRMAALAQHGPVVMAQLFDYDKRPQALRGGQLSGGVPAEAAGQAVVAHGFIANHAALARVARAGNIGVSPDRDGVLRRVPMYTFFEGRRYPTLARALFDCCAGAPALADSGTQGAQRIAYARRWGAYTVAKAADVLDQNVPPALIAGRLVLLGSSSLSIGDRVATPLAPSTAGLLVHAALLTSLLERQAGQAAAAWPGKWIALLFALGVSWLSAYTFPRLSAAANVAILAGTSMIWLALAYLVALHDGEFSTAGPLLSNLFLLAFAVPFHWQLTQRKSRQLLGTLRQYVAKEVVDELLRSGLKDPLAPRQLQVTTLIADMEGYTTQVESLPVEEAAQLTTDFLHCLTRPVLEKHGTLDKYTGDGLVAFWGAPLPNADHADLALDAAREVVRAVRRLSQARVQAGKPALRVRIGIESGLAMVGDYGTSFRSIYTAVGDSVNTASRLEQAARDFAHDIIIGEGTVGRARRHRFTLLGQRLLRGKEKPINLYTLESDA
jgi:adenylate cyclase